MKLGLIKVENEYYLGKQEKVQEGEHGIVFAHGLSLSTRGHYTFFHDGRNVNILNSICSETLKMTHSTKEIDGIGKLSLENCQAIENGYHLENMADFYGAKAKGSVDFKLGASQGFEDGFKKAIELNEKLFTIENMIEAISLHRKSFTTAEIIKSFQKTKWEVEIVIESMNIDEIREQGQGFLNANLNKPKLDDYGFVILKRIQHEA